MSARAASREWKKSRFGIGVDQDPQGRQDPVPVGTQSMGSPGRLGDPERTGQAGEPGQEHEAAAQETDRAQPPAADARQFGIILDHEPSLPDHRESKIPAEGDIKPPV
jgi:hypothetical protein